MQEEIGAYANNSCENNGQFTGERLYVAFSARTRCLVVIQIQQIIHYCVVNHQGKSLRNKGFKHKFSETGPVYSYIFCDMSACFSGAYINTFV